MSGLSQVEQQESEPKDFVTAGRRASLSVAFTVVSAPSGKLLAPAVCESLRGWHTAQPDAPLYLPLRAAYETTSVPAWSTLGQSQA